MVKFIRTFHPVGQGAFYTEQIVDTDLEVKRPCFNMVYDCGSITRNTKEKIRHIIDSTLNKGEIDILFLSHFDEDHINGAENLSPKYIVLPFLTSEKLKILEVLNYMRPAYLPRYSLDAYRTIHTHLKDFKGTIVYILDTDDSKDNALESLEIESNNRFNIRQATVRLTSGATIRYTYPSANHYNSIEYVVYQPNWDKFISHFIELFEKELKIDWATFTPASDSDFLHKNMEILRDIYNKLRPKNAHSLLVCSNPDAESPNSKFANHSSLHTSDNLLTVTTYRINNTQPGCIYFGDSQMGGNLPDDFYRILGSQRTQRIGTLQVPHHGAHSSLGDRIYSPDGTFPTPPLCIISAGLQNQFQHPNATIVSNLIGKKCPVHIVTEHPSSRLCEEWQL